MLSTPPTTGQSRPGGGEPPATRTVPAIANYEPWSPCVETSRVVGDRFKTPWGTTPRDVLKIALGTHRATFTWQRQNSFSYNVEGTRTTLLVEITRRGRATFFKRNGAQRVSDMAYDCRSTLVIPVHVEVTTHDGAINVQGESDLTVTSRHHPLEVSLGQSFATHRGTLRIGEIRQKGLSIPGFGISLGFTSKRTMVGAIRGSYEIENVGGEFVEYACFPDKPPRELRNSDADEVGCRD